MFKEFIIAFWIVIQLMLIFFKLSVAENVSWWWIFTPLYFVLVSYLIGEFVKEIKK